MPFAQSTIEEIVESERLMVLGAKERYGPYYTHLRGVSVVPYAMSVEISVRRSPAV